jgi:hypothetical protein
MKKAFTTALIVVAHLLPAMVFSQAITIHESSKEKKDYLHEFFKPVPTGNEVIYTSYNFKIAGRSAYRPGIIRIR